MAPRWLESSAVGDVAILAASECEAISSSVPLSKKRASESGTATDVASQLTVVTEDTLDRSAEYADLREQRLLRLSENLCPCVIDRGLEGVWLLRALEPTLATPRTTIPSRRFIAHNDRG